MRRTKIVATLGPASERLVPSLSKRVDIFRLNFAHGNEAQHKMYFNLIRKNASRAAILVDLPGPKMRVGDLPSPIRLSRGQDVVFSCSGEGIPVQDPSFFRVIAPGTVVLLADSEIKVKTTKVNATRAEGKVLAGGILTSRKGINVPKLAMEAGLTNHDRELLKEALALGADAIGLSFVTSSKTIQEARLLAPNSFLVAKIEKAQALEELHDIAISADAVMVARGDLGVEVGLERLPSVQDRIIRVSRSSGKPVILATQVLESMVTNSSPTRAEVVDVANSVAKGVDAIMLSDETAAGINPLAAVRYLDIIAARAERDTHPWVPQPRDENDALASAAVGASDVAQAKAIVAHSRSGLTVARVSMFRPRSPILALAEDDQKMRQMNFYWGVIPFRVPAAEDINQMLRSSWTKAAEAGLAKRGDKVVVVAGEPSSRKGVTNLIEIHEISREAGGGIPAFASDPLNTAIG